MRQDPRVITGCCRRQRSLPLTLENAQVDAARLGVAPAQIPGRHHERALVSKYLTQVMQFAAQIGQRLRVRRVRPEHPGDALPGLRRPGMGSQKRDQGYRVRRTHLNGSLVAGDGLLPQQGHVQHVDVPP